MSFPRGPWIAWPRRMRSPTATTVRARRQTWTGLSIVLVLCSGIWASCKSSDGSPMTGGSAGAGEGVPVDQGSGGTTSLGGAGGLGGRGEGGQGALGGGPGGTGNGGAGDGGIGGGPSDQGCHTNGDCPANNVCLIRALITDCQTAPAGRCVPYDQTCSRTTNNSDRCDCLDAMARDACAGQPSDFTCSSASGRELDYTSPTSCFGCYRTTCEINGATYSSDFDPLTLPPFTGGAPCGDGCNTCWCTRHGVISTAIGCPAGGAPGSAGAGGHGGSAPGHAGAGGNGGGQGGGGGA